jgi:hypothetical protein
MNAIEDASTHAASTIRRRFGGTSRPNSCRQGSAAMIPRLHGSGRGCAIFLPLVQLSVRAYAG